MIPKYMTKMEASKYYKILEENDFKPSNDLSDDYIILRNRLLNEFENINTQANEKPYMYDLLYGLLLYEIINENFEENYQVISNLNFWIYINMMVIPDLVFFRYNKRVDRFYKHTKRVWTNQIYWYIHLSWQGSYEETFKVLENNSTDTIVQLVERVTLNRGYNHYLYREMMKQLYLNEISGTEFRKVAVLNTLYTQTIEPEFYEGSYEGYVSMLFSKIK